MAPPVAQMPANATRTIVITMPAKNALARHVTTMKKPTTAIAIQSAPTIRMATAVKQQQRKPQQIVPTRLTIAPASLVPLLGKRVAADCENVDPYVGRSSPVMIQPPRKRERLTHLSPEEKLNRRKYKNRVAAQTARDRKKVRLTKLEDVVRKLNEENARLSADNARLQRTVEKLSAENANLQQQKHDSDGAAEAFGSAVSIRGPLQQELVSATPSVNRVQLTTLLLAYLTSICSASSTNCCKERNASSTETTTMTKATLQETIKLLRQSPTRRSLTRQQAQTLRGIWKALKHKQSLTVESATA